MTGYRLRDRAGEQWPYSPDTLFLPIYTHDGSWWCSRCRFSSRDFSKLLGHEQRHGSIALLKGIAPAPARFLRDSSKGQ